MLTEIYPIVGKINLDLAKDRKSTITIDEYDFQNDALLKNPKNSKWQEKYEQYDFKSDIRWIEVRSREALAALSDYNDIIIGLRNLLYSEIELSNYKILDEEYNEDISNILFELGLQLTNFFEESFESIFDYYHYLRLRIDTNSPRVRELIDFIDTRIYRRRVPIPLYRLSLIIECMEAIKNSGLVVNADRLWNIFLLKLYSVALLNNPLNEFQEINIRSDSGRYESIIQNSYRQIDDSLLMIQHNNAQNMLMLYSMNRFSSRAFYNRDVIRQLYNALNSSDDLRGRYLNNIKYNNDKNRQNPSGRKSSPKCFAAMYNRDTRKKYAAISGVFDADMYIHRSIITNKERAKLTERKKKYNDLVLLLKNILGNSYEVIDSDDEVKYYYTKNGKHKHITAQKYINSPHPIDKQPGNRMFSCCERKLSTKLEPGCEHDFYIKYAPCILCDRMIKEETRNNSHFINVFYTGKIKDIERSKLALYDKSADASN